MMHRAVILLNIEVHPLEGNECTGKIISSTELKKYDLKSKMIITVDGETLDQCLIKVRDLVNVHK